MRQTVSLQDGILPSAGATVVWSLAIVILLAAGSPPLQACDGGTAVPDPENNSGLVADCRVLLGLRDELAGTDSLNWDAGLAITDWEGVEVSESPSRVTDLDLTGYGLTGKIPAELVQLTQLRELHICCNQLTGEIPTELGQLTLLTFLSLGDNQLTGEIPTQLAQLTLLTNLSLRGNQLTGKIPPQLGQLSHLWELELHVNQLTGSIPTELGNLASLTGLHLSDNQLTGSIPTELGNLASLTYLNLNRNHLTGAIPTELGNLASLTGLHLSDNQLTGSIPTELGNLASLTELSLEGNQLSGTIPTELGNLASLTYLNLSYNQLTGTLPQSFTSLMLKHFYFDGNPGLSVPEDADFLAWLNGIGDLDGDKQALIALYKATDGPNWTNNENWLSDEPLDAWHGVIVSDGRVPSLNLSENQLTGPIPPELGQLSQLVKLILHNNKLTGSIPPELSQLNQLEYLTLFNNQLTGTIPPELGQLTRLQELPLYNNQLTGKIPSELGQLTRLQYLTLFNNRLTGRIPPELGQLSQLQYLTLFNNQLTGAIPPELGQLSQLWSLGLDHNQLTGEIPPELGQLSQLRWLSLGHNQLTGAIPAELGHLSRLRLLALDHNQLTGEIPPELGQLSQLQRLHLQNNRLTGQIPPELDQLPNLEEFSHWGNQLTETGPSEPDAAGRLFVPVILTSAGRNNSLFTSELTLTNRGSEPAILHYTYTANRGGGSGAATDRLAPKRQRIEPNAISYLKNLGVPIPESGSRIGTLRVRISGSSAVSVVTRTSTAVPDGRAGLSYPGIAEDEGFHEAVYLCGLRQNSQDRSNVAFQNMGAPEDGSIILRTTVFSGDAADASARMLKDVELGPGEFHQFNGVLGDKGDPMFGGYVKVERVEGMAPFYAYGVINDQANSDGSFVFPVTESSLVGKRGQTLPVIIETGTFNSELTVTNFSPVAKTVDFRFVAKAVETDDDTASFSLELKAGEQQILPHIVNWLRQDQDGAGIGPANRAFVGALFATVAGGDMSGIVIGARTGSPDKRGGQYSLFYNAVPYGSASIESAWIYGLQQNEENRSNLALVNTGEIDNSSSIFEITIYDGSGDTQPRTKNVTLGPRRWTQQNGILGNIRQGYVQVRKVSGNNPFITYGVINDGGKPGQRSGDGAYVPARE